MAKVENGVIEVYDCGITDRTIRIYKSNPKQIHIGCYRGDKESALEEVSKKYSNSYKLKTDYLKKINEAFDAVPWYWHIPVPTIKVDKEFAKAVWSMCIAITVVTILVSIVSLVLIKPKDPFMVYETLKEKSLTNAYMYLSVWCVTGITILKALFNNIKISWR